jgi:iron complex outermembrane receptor protein
VVYRRGDHAERHALSHPGIDGADHQTRIDGHQTKFTAKANTGRMPRRSTPSALGGATDYHHNDRTCRSRRSSTVGIRQKFNNKEQRVSLSVDDAV